MDIRPARTALTTKAQWWAGNLEGFKAMFKTEKESMGYAREDITPAEAQAAYDRFMVEMLSASIRYLGQTGVNPAQAGEIVLTVAFATAHGVKGIRKGMDHAPEILAQLPNAKDWGANVGGFIPLLKKFTTEILASRKPRGLEVLLEAIKNGLAVPTGAVLETREGVQKHINELGPGNIAVNEHTGEVILADGEHDKKCDNPDCPVHGENGLLSILRGKAQGDGGIQVIDLEDLRKPDDPLKIN